MAPVGSRESLAAALRAGAGSVYFGIERLNMRAGSASAFTEADLRDIAEQCRRLGVRTYLTLNTTVHDDDMPLMRQIIGAAREAGLTAVIAGDVAVMEECRRQGVAVHLSTQLNIANAEAVAFYARWADVVVLARELTLEQVRRIHDQIVERDIRGPGGRRVRIEMFCHGALCMAQSGKCYLSLHEAWRSANRGQCVQVCRRAYDVRDRETGRELTVDGPYIMSPRDLCTVRFVRQLLEAGVEVFKIEGRARGPEYVQTAVECYRQALENPQADTAALEERLRRVFNRGFWDGYYLGQRLGEWNDRPGSAATEHKTYAARVTRYFPRLGVAELRVQAAPVTLGQRLLVTGPTTGALYIDNVQEIHGDDCTPITTGRQGDAISIATPGKVRVGDKVFIITEQ